MDEDDRGPNILVTNWMLAGLSGLFLAVRLACKLRATRQLWWDDYVLVVSWVSAPVKPKGCPTECLHVVQLTLLVSVILVTASVPKGLGKHVSQVPVENMAFLSIVGNFTGTFSILAAMWSKTSFCLTLLRLFSGRMRIMLWVIIATINIFMALNAIFLWTRCTPTSKTWNPFISGTCWESQVYPSYGMFAAGEFKFVPRGVAHLLKPKSVQVTPPQWTFSWRCCRGRSSGSCK